MFGLPLDTPPQDRPVYGYLSLGGLRAARPREGVMSDGKWQSGDFLSTYGEVQVVLKPSVRARTTASHGDSIDNGIIPSSVDDPSWLSFGAQGRMSTGWDPPNPTDLYYTEAQIHGGVRVEDIDEVVFNSEPDAATKAALKKAGVQWRILGPDRPAAGHSRVEGRDVREDLDYAAIDSLPVSRRQVAMVGGDPGDPHGDRKLSAIYDAQGFHGKPEVVSEADLDRRIAAGWTELWRGNGVLKNRYCNHCKNLPKGRR